MPDSMPEPTISPPLSTNGLDAWQVQTLRDTWRIFRIMAEFVDGFETMSRVGPCLTVFGSARIERGSSAYELARSLTRLAVLKGYGIITGGGPGIMEAANRGAQESGGVSVGLNIDLPFEQTANAYIDRDRLINFNFFFVRKVMLLKYAQAVIVLPGGFGTLDELFEAVTLIQTNKASPFPVVLIGTEFWGGLIDWIKRVLLSSGMISRKDLDLLVVTDDPAAAIAAVEAFYKEKDLLKPNF